MTSNAIPTSVSFYPGSSTASQPSRAAEAPPPPPPAPHFVPMLPEDMNLDGMTKRALSMVLGTKVDLIV
jgi:hypothetical protein